MNYKITDEFTVRTASKSYQTLGKLLFNDEKNVDVFELFEEESIKEAVQVSSYSLYSSLRESKGDIEKQRLGLKNYLSRLCMRTTPYGYSAGVGRGKFSEEIRDNKITYQKKIRPDSEWLFKVIRLIEDSNFEKLSFSWNKGTTILANKVANDWNTCFVGNGSEEFDKNLKPLKSYVNYTKAVALIQEKATKFTTFDELLDLLVENYPQGKKAVFHKFIRELFEKEFLISDVRGTPLTSNKMEAILEVVRKKSMILPFEDGKVLEVIERKIN